MTTLKRFNLPDLGEGLTEGEILQWLVKPGERITLNQPIVEVETAKAAVEIPSPYAGLVVEFYCDEGQTVDVGSPIIAVDTNPAATMPPPAPRSVPPASAGAGTTPSAIPPSAGTLESVRIAAPGEPAEPGLIGGPAPGPPEAGNGPGGRVSVLVGYGPRTGPAARRPRRATLPDTADDPGIPMLPTIPDSLSAGVKPVRHGGLEIGRAAELRAAESSAPILAKPPIRKLAKDLGVDLSMVHATGPGGVITRADVQRSARRSGSPAGGPDQLPTAERPVITPAASSLFTDGSREHRIPVRGVRKLTAEAMVHSAFTAPHVTEWLTIDITATVTAIERLRRTPGWTDARLSPLVLVAKALLTAVRRHPMINSSWVEETGEIVVKDYVNLGIAAATPRGLVVPNIRDAGRLSLRDLADRLTSLVATAKEGRTAPADMQGGTITITNVGVFGVDAGTPILNPGEAAILAIGAIRDMPWVVDGAVVPRKVATLALSFDHRVVDGELGSLVLADVGAFLTDPGTSALAWG